MYAYRGPYMMFNIVASDDGETKNIIERVFGEHNLYASEADSGDGSVFGGAAVPIDEYYNFIADMYESIGERVINCPEFTILESAASYVVVKTAADDVESADQIRSAMINSGLYLEEARTVNGWDLAKYSGTGINVCLLYSHYQFIKDFLWDDYDDDPVDPPTPVLEEITMFAYAYEEGMIDPDWRVFNQIDTVYVYLRQNGWDTSSMSAEDGRRYDDGELGERIMTVRGPQGYADAFRAEYRRRYPDYDTILIRKDYLPERGRPAPEPTNEREYNCYHDPYDWSDMYRTIEQIQMESAQYMADVYVNPSDDWEPISDPDTGEVIGHGRIIIRTTDEYQDIITANGQQWYYPAPIRPAGK